MIGRRLSLVHSYKGRQTGIALSQKYLQLFCLYFCHYVGVENTLPGGSPPWREGGYGLWPFTKLHLLFFLLAIQVFHVEDYTQTIYGAHAPCMMLIVVEYEYHRYIIGPRSLSLSSSSSIISVACHSHHLTHLLN